MSLTINHQTNDISASDVHALADKITDEWRTYRQALRDLPAAEGFPDVAFPTPPS